MAWRISQTGNVLLALREPNGEFSAPKQMRLTRDEILLIVSIMVALIGGAVVKHYRDRARLVQQPQPAPTAEMQGQD